MILWLNIDSSKTNKLQNIFERQVKALRFVTLFYHLPVSNPIPPYFSSYSIRRRISSSNYKGKFWKLGSNYSSTVGILTIQRRWL